MNEAEVSELQSRAVRGDADAISRLLEHFGPQVEAALHIGRRWRSAIDIADVMQVTYLEAFMQIGRFDAGRGLSFLRWLRTIAANNLRDAVRGLSAGTRPPPDRRITPRPLEESASEFMEKLGVTTTTPSRNARRGEASRILLAAIDQLPPAYREVVRRYDLDGRPMDEVASSIGRTSGAVHMLRARAHERLRELLGGNPDILGSRA